MSELLLFLGVIGVVLLLAGYFWLWDWMEQNGPFPREREDK